MLFGLRALALVTVVLSSDIENDFSTTSETSSTTLGPLGIHNKSSVQNQPLGDTPDLFLSKDLTVDGVFTEIPTRNNTNASLSNLLLKDNSTDRAQTTEDFISEVLSTYDPIGSNLETSEKLPLEESRIKTETTENLFNVTLSSANDTKDNDTDVSMLPLNDSPTKTAKIANDFFPQDPSTTDHNKRDAGRFLMLPESANSSYVSEEKQVTKRFFNSTNVNESVDIPTTPLQLATDNETTQHLDEKTSTPSYNTVTGNLIGSTENSLQNVASGETRTLKDATTRIPKRIQSIRNRPARPDPGYTDSEIRPYRPDTPIHRYYKPEETVNRPSLAYVSQGGFGRPYRPDLVRPSSEELNSTNEAQNSFRRPDSLRPFTDKHLEYSTDGQLPQGSFGRPYRPDSLRPSTEKAQSGRPYRPDSIRPSTEKHLEHYTDVQSSPSGRPYRPDTLRPEKFSTYSTEDHSIQGNFGKPYRPYSGESQSSFRMPYRPATDELSRADHEYTRLSPEEKPRVATSTADSLKDAQPFSVGTVTGTKNITRVEYLKADCFDNYMKVTIRFNSTFEGLIYSTGYAQDLLCSYVNGSGRNQYEFLIRLNRCGTLGQENTGEPSRKRKERAQYLVNTVTVQYNPVIEEDLDEHFRVTCEYGYDFWKTVTFPVLSVESASLQQLRTGSPVVFTLPPPQCTMELRRGLEPDAPRITGPVNVGDPVTLRIHMKSDATGYDIFVNNCYAHNGAQKRLQLIDSNGCVVEEKLMSAFRGSPEDTSQHITLSSHLKAFRFTGSPALYLECDVHMCHGSCPAQRCNWRSKRSAEENTSMLSESISLFQALEVRHLDSPQTNCHSDVICIGSGSFAALTTCVLLLVLSTCVCMCVCMRRMREDKKKLQQLN